MADVLKDTTFAFRTTQSVSISSAAPICGLRTGVASFGGTVKDRRAKERACGAEGARSGVTGSDEDDISVSKNSSSLLILQGEYFPVLCTKRGWPDQGMIDGIVAARVSSPKHRRSRAHHEEEKC